MTRSRRHFTAQQKLAVVRRHLVDKTPVSQCDKFGLQPTQIHTWQKQLLENGDSAFTKPRYHRTIKGDCIRVTNIEPVEDARRIVDRYIRHYNEVCLHCGIGYVTPHTKLAGKEMEVFSEHHRKLESAREQRRLRRQQQAA